MVCVSADEETVEIGCGLTSSVPELVSIVTAQSLAKLQEEEGVDTAVFKEL